MMPAPQMEFYAAERAGRTAIISTATGQVCAWVERNGDMLRARTGDWRSPPEATIPSLIVHVAARARGRDAAAT